MTHRRMAELLADLCASLGRPFGAQAELMVRTWLEDLEGWSDEAIEWAIQRARKTCKKWPKPAEIAELCAASPFERVAVPREAIDPIRLCPDCGEWCAWHRIACTREPTRPYSSMLHTVRHRDGCDFRPSEDRYMRVYVYSWVDSLPATGALEEGGEAWRAPYVGQLIAPLPPLPHVYEDEARAERRRRAAARSPYTAPPRKPMEHLAALIPPSTQELVGRALIEAGDAAKL